MFKRLIIKDWRQFSEIDISFHPHLTVLTGANGAGKTTILNLLAIHFGWQSQFVSAYKKDEKTGLLRYSNSIHKLGKQIKRLFIKKSVDSVDISNNKIGEIEYGNDWVADLTLPDQVNNTYGVNITNNQRVLGVYINSHRPTFPYRMVKNIPTQVKGRDEIYGKYLEFTKTFVHDSYRNSNEMSATSLIKETIASLAMFGYGNQAVSPNEEAKKLFEDYEEILRVVLPPKMGFERIKVIIPEVILCTQSGEFPIDAVSGGISSIIDITWQLFMYAEPKENFVAIIDEPENHLHPELQKTFLHNLIKAFPNVQFIVATHNPFMISAEKDSNVYVLDYDNEKKVHSLMLDYVNRAGTSNAILREVLGIDSTMPFWAEEILNEITRKYSVLEVTKENLDNLRDELTKIGLDGYIPETIAEVVERKTDD